MISDTWPDHSDPTATGPDADDPADALPRPVWEAESDETDADLPPRAPRPGLPLGAPALARTADPLGGLDLAALLGPLCDAQDVLARLDARASVAPDAIRDGLIARMALAEAAGWLAHAHAWVHPLDLALRALGLTGSAAVAATGGGPRVMPHTFARFPVVGARSSWDDPTFDDLAGGDHAIADALTLARSLPRLAGIFPRDPLASLAAAEALFAPFGAGGLEEERYARWRLDHPSKPPPQRRFGRAGEGAPPALPPLLRAAQAAAAWMVSGIADVPTPLQALLAASGLLAGSGLLRVVFVPVWAAYPAAGYGDRDALPGLRSDVIDRLAGRGRNVTWPVVFLHLVAEGARAGLRDLDRLLAAAEKGRGLGENCDRRSRLPDGIEALLRVPVLTPKALAARLRIAPQTATALMRDLRAAGLAREVTGRGSFRAFAI